MFFFKSSTLLWQHRPPVSSLLHLKLRASPAITARAPGLPGTPAPTLNLHISQHSVALVRIFVISPQTTAFCTIRVGDIHGRPGRTTQALKYTGSTLRMPERRRSSVPWAPPRVSRSQSLLCCATVLRVTDRDYSKWSCLVKDVRCLGECPWGWLISRINRPITGRTWRGFLWK